MVGGLDQFGVVLHRHHCVAQVAQSLEGADQLVGVVLVKSRGGLVQHVEHALQARADLAGQADALGLAAREGVAGAVELQVAHAHLGKELEPPHQLAQHRHGHCRRRGAFELEAVEEGKRLVHR